VPASVADGVTEIVGEEDTNEEDVDPNERPPDEVLQDLVEQEAEEQEAGVTAATSSGITEDDPAIQAAVDRTAPLIRTNETTAQAHARLTNQQPWHPFHKGAATRPTEIHLEEFAVFNSMQARFKRGVRPRAKDGCHSFANEWNSEVGNRCGRHAEGEDAILIRRKSAVQLQEHCDNLLQQKRMAASADSESDRVNRQDLRDIMRTTREEVHMPAIPTAATAQHPNDGVAPFGMPAAMHPTALQGAIVHMQMENATRPWQMRQFTNTNNVLVGFKKATWCVTCGCRKAAHVQEESFGHKCRRDCCAKCGWRQEHHQSGSGRMGPFCTNASQFDSPHTQWHETRGETRNVGII